ncbi:MucBP domain-containing protein [Ligilactobacillus salivarius]|uniref:mucin-binding protein n=1 Tax=Ligilactobacillus salivarius TaxID=1624 RepID=UPI00397743CF
MLGRKNIKLKKEKLYDRKQIYGLKKLSIGTVSVLLGMSFIIFDAHTVSANTTDAVQETENTNNIDTVNQEKTVTLKSNETSAINASETNTSVSTNVTDKSTSDEIKTLSNTSSIAENSISTENVNSRTDSSEPVKITNSLTSTNTAEPTANEAPSNLQGVRPTVEPTHTDTSSIDANGFTLSLNRSTVGNDGDAGKDLNIILSGTFYPGYIYTIKVPVTSFGINDSAFTPEKLNGRAEIVKSDEIIDGEKYKVYKVISIGSYTVTDGLRIVVPDGNNYAGQPNVNSSNHLDPNGPIKRQIFWSYQNSADPSKVINNYPLEFTSIVQTSMAPTIRQVKPDPKYVKNLRVDTRYDFEIDINQPTGVGDSGYGSNKVNNTQNLGTTITVPVPGNFLLDPQASMDASKLGSNSGVTFTQDKAGGDVIITIPAGSGSQNYQDDTGYHLVGKFIQTIEPFGKRDYSANGLITVDQKIRTTNGEKDLTAQVNNPWTVTLVGPKFTPQDGQFEVVIAGNNTAKQFTQSQPTRVVNYFGFQNSTAISYTNSLHIEAAFPDGLDVTGVKTPGINNTMRPGTTSYVYNIETKSGKILSGVVNAGETILAPTGEYILKVDIIPNYVEVGASTKYGGDVDNIIKDNIGNRQADDPDIFEALGTLSDAMNSMAVIPPDTVLTTKLAVFSPDFNNNTYYTLSIDQKVQGLDQLKASIGAWRYQSNTMYNPKNTDPNYYGKFDTHMYGGGYTTDRIYEPIIYYVLPKYFSYGLGWNGVQLKTTDDNGKVVVPKYSTYVVDGQQIIKFDYSGTGYSMYTRNQSTNQIYITMDPDAVAGKYPYEVYMYTRTGLINYNAKYTSSNVTDIVNQYTGNIVASNVPGSLYKLNTVYGNYFVVDKQIITYVPVTSQGNQNPKSVLVGTSDDKGDNTLSYYLNIANYDSNDLSAARLLIDLPQKSDGASSYDVHLSGPVVYDKSYGNLSENAYTILYSTNTQDLPNSSVKGTQTSLEGYIPADQVTDWSQIKSIMVVFNESIPSQNYVGRFIVKGTDPTFKEDAGKIGYIKAALTGDNFSPFTVNNSGIKIQGTSTVTARLHYQDENGIDKYIDIPAMTKTYSDNVDTLKSSDFSASSVPADMIPKGYEVSGSPQLIIINKDDVNNAAKFDSLVKYYFDGDIVQFELSEIVTTETKKVTQNVYYIYDSSSAKYQAGGTNLDNAIVVNGQKVSPTTVTYTVTRKTHQASGKKEYIVVNDKTGEALTVDSKGNFVIPGVTEIPSLPGYTASGLDVTNAQSNTNFNIDSQFQANTGSDIELDKTITYTPNSQNLSYRMYNTTQKKWIADNPIPFMTGKTDDTVNGGIDAFDKKIHDFLIPSAYILNRVNYYDVTTGNFVDFTDEPGTEGNYVLKVPANFNSDNSKNIITLYVSDPISYSAENKVVTRTITYHDKDENNALINTANANINKDTYPDTTTDTITFTRYKVIDQVTGNVLGYYKPSQMESVNGKLVPKAGEDYIPYTSDTANASSAFEILVNGAYTTSAKFGNVTPYDLTKYGYQPAVDMNGNTLTIITGRTVQVTTSNFEEHVFYKHQWANINPNTKPQEGQKVDSTDNSPVYPKNSYDLEDSISTVKRIIHHVYAIGTKIDGVDVSRKPVNGLNDTIQMITYYQDAQIDLVTGNINYLGTWKAVKSETTQNGVTTITPNYNQFTAVTSPEIDNYKPVQSTIDALTPNRQDKTLDVYVIYVPNTTSVVVNYLDQDNANGVIFAKTLNGSHGDKIDYTTADEINYLKQKGYELVDDGFTDEVGDKYYDSSKSQVWTVLLKHKKLVITADNPHSSDEKITTSDGYQHSYPNGIDEQDLNTTVSREIDFKYNQGVYRNGQNVSGQQAVDDNGNLIENVVQKVPYVRTATIDLVKLADNNQANTAVTYSNWVSKNGGSGDFASFTVPEIKGYHASTPIVPEMTPIKDIQGKPQNAKNLTVLYDAEDRTIEIVFVDGDGNVVEPQYPITGKTGETVPVTDGEGNPIKPPEGWKYKYPDDPDKVVPGTITLTPDGTPELKIPIEHATVRVDPNDPHEANTGEDPDNSIRPYPAGVGKDDLNHTVTRTIIVHMPDGTTREKKQELLFQRWATVDELNGNVTYDPWLPKNGTTFEAVQAEDVVATPSGYTPGQGAPMVEGVTEKSEDSTFDIVYTPNDQHAVLRIVDDDTTINGEPKEIFTTSATGKYGTIINFADLDNELNDLKSKNYQVENNFNKETKYQADDANNKFVIHLSHKKTVVGGGLSVREKISYIYVDSNNDKHSIADDYITDVGSRVAFTQTGMLDLVTGKYTWNHDWKIENNKFDTVASPNIQGYVIRQGMEEVPAQMVAISEDGTITIKDDKLGGKISRVSSDGSTATYFVSYEMYYDAADQKTTVTYVDDDLSGRVVGSIREITGKTFESVETNITNPDKDKYEIVNENQIPNEIVFGTNGYPAITVHLNHKHKKVTRNKTVTRTIQYQDESGQVLKQVDQSLNFTQSGNKDLVTNQVSWNKVPSQSFEEVKTPEKVGYTPDKAVVPSETVTFDTEDYTETVVYRANEQKGKVVYVDDDKDGQEVKQGSISGKTGETVKVTPEVPENYEEVAGNPTDYTFPENGTDESNVVTIHLKHKHEAVTRDNTVTRTIEYQDEKGNLLDTKSQSLTFTQPGDKDLVTDQVIWSTDVPSQSFDEVKTPEKAGYTPDRAIVPSETVTFDTEDYTETVVYRANEQKGKVVYVDDDKDGQEVKQGSISGKTGETVKVTPEVPENYEEVAGNPTDYTFPENGTDESNVVTIHLKHKHEVVTRDNTVTRTIEYQDEKGNLLDTKSQSLTFTQPGDKDLVTDQVIWSTDVPSQSFDEVKTPEKAGYTPDRAIVPSETVTFDTEDYTETVVYRANEQKGKVVYVDDDKDGQEVKQGSISGKTGETVKVTPEVPENYEEVAGNPTDYTFPENGTDESNVVTIHLKHKHEVVTRDNTVTRTIEYRDEQGNLLDTKSQSLTFAQPGDKDLVTDQVIWSTDVPSQSFDEVKTPEKAGYTPDRDIVPSETVTFDTKDYTETVVYKANEQTGRVVYVDDDNGGQEVKQGSISGKTGETVKVTPEVPDNYEEVGGNPTDYTFPEDGTDESNIVTIHLKHKHEAVTRDNVVTRTIEYRDEQGNLLDTKSQSLTFAQPGDKDLVTDQVIWSTDVPSQSFDEVKTPEKAGYTPDRDIVPSETVTFDTKDYTETVVYKANEQTGRVVYVDDDNGGQEVKQGSISGKTGETVKVTPEVPDNYEEVGGNPTDYTFPEDGTDESNIVTIHLKHKHEAVTRDNVVTRTIEYRDEQGNLLDTKSQSLTFAQPGDKDLVTDQVIWSTDVPSQSFDEVKTPEKVGYTPDKAVVPSETVTFDTKDYTETVVYKANEQTGRVVYVDDDNGGQEVKQGSISGKTGETVKVTPEVPDNYEEVGGNPTDYTFPEDGTDESNVVTIHLKHKHEAVTRDKVVTRTIEYRDEKGNLLDTKSQSLTFTQPGDKDLVTGQVTWSTDVPSQSFDEVKTPEKVGYTPDKAVVPSETVTFDTKDYTETVVYKANEQTGRVVYVDDDNGGQKVKQGSISGKTGETVKVTPEVPENYEEVAGNPTDYTFPEDGTDESNVVTIHLKHKHETVTRDNVVTRTIEYRDEKGNLLDTKSQSLTFTQPGDKDLVTNQVTWSTDVPSQSFDEVKTPEKVGYTPDKAVVPSETVTFDTKDYTETVVYKANEQTGRVVYVDDDNGGQEVKQGSIFGKTGETVKVTPEVPENYEEVAGNPTDYTFPEKGTDESNVVTIHLKHKHEAVTRDKVVTRTIEYQDEKGNLLDTKSQSLKFTQPGDKDLVTNQVIWNTNVPSQSFDEVKTPEKAGYTPDKASVTAKEVTINDSNTTEVVVYKANIVNVVINYEDNMGNKLADTGTVSGKEGNEFTTQALEITGYHLISESKLVHGIFGKTLEITFVYEKNSTDSTKNKNQVDKNDNNGKESKVETKTKKSNDFKNTINSKDKVNTKVSSQTLPQTGDQKDNTASLVGLILMSLAGLFGFKRKNKRDN